MSMYDHICVGDKIGQVKLWDNRLVSYDTGDEVPYLSVGENVLSGERDFDIAMREGGFVHVRDLKIVGWDDDAEVGVSCYDKWGGLWVSSEANIGEAGQALAEAVGARSSYFFDPE